MAILQRPYAGQVKNLTPPAAGCGGWFLAVGGVICCGRWAARLAGCGRCAGGAGLALVRGHRVRRSAAGVVIWCGAGGADPSRCRWWAQYPCTVSSAPRVLSSFSPGRLPTTPSACRAADPAGRAGGRRRAKEKGQGGGAACAAALAFGLHWRQWFRRGASRCRWWG